MTAEQSCPLSTGPARAALIAGILGLVLLAAYFLTPLGAFTLYAGMASGLSGAALGVVALKHNQHFGASVTGLVNGAFTFLTGASIVLFALIFVGAFG